MATAGRKRTKVLARDIDAICAKVVEDFVPWQDASDELGFNTKGIAGYISGDPPKKPHWQRQINQATARSHREGVCRMLAADSNAEVRKWEFLLKALRPALYREDRSRSPQKELQIHIHCGGGQVAVIDGITIVREGQVQQGPPIPLLPAAQEEQPYGEVSQEAGGG